MQYALLTPDGKYTKSELHAIWSAFGTLQLASFSTFAKYAGLANYSANSEKWDHAYWAIRGLELIGMLERVRVAGCTEGYWQIGPIDIELLVDGRPVVVLEYKTNG